MKWTMYSVYLLWCAYLIELSVEGLVCGEVWVVLDIKDMRKGWYAKGIGKASFKC